MSKNLELIDDFYTDGRNDEIASSALDSLDLGKPTSQFETIDLADSQIRQFGRQVLEVYRLSPETKSKLQQTAQKFREITESAGNYDTHSQVWPNLGELTNLSGLTDDERSRVDDIIGKLQYSGHPETTRLQTIISDLRQAADVLDSIANKD